MGGLVGLALLVIMTQALRAHFGAAVAVHQSPDEPVDVSQTRTICLFVERSSSKPESAAFSGGDSQIVIRLELYAPVVSGAGPDALAGSAALPFLWRGVVAALAPECGVWGAAFENFRLALEAEQYAPPLFQTEKGVKVAAHVYLVTIDSLAEPLFGAGSLGEGSAWAHLLTTMRAAGGELPAVADRIEAAIRGGLTDWRALAASLGLSRGSADAIGVGPGVDEAVAPPVAADLVVDPAAMPE